MPTCIQALPIDGTPAGQSVESGCIVERLAIV